jgi:hypothetical protein
MKKEDKKEGFHVLTLLSDSLAFPLNFITVAKTSVGVEIISPNRVLESTTPNWW